MKIFKSIFPLEVKTFKFPGGELGVKLNPQAKFTIPPSHLNVPAVMIQRAVDSDAFLEMALAKDAIERQELGPVNLLIPYFPYARQDRVCVPGEPLSLLVYAKLISSLGFNQVTVIDPHSIALETALPGVRIITQFGIIQQFHEFKIRVGASNTIFVSPDAGAEKKTSEIASYFDHPEIVSCRKVRNLATGDIKEVVVYTDDFKGRDVVIADDICDGGRTYTELVPLLKAKNAGKVILYVTHGIFSKGLAALYMGGVDEIYTTTSFHTKEEFDTMLFEAAARIGAVSQTTPNVEELKAKLTLKDIEVVR